MCEKIEGGRRKEEGGRRKEGRGRREEAADCRLNDQISCQVSFLTFLPPSSFLSRA
jgi:hypothetical protein